MGTKEILGYNFEYVLRSVLKHLPHGDQRAALEQAQLLSEVRRVMLEWRASDKRISMPGSKRSRFLVERVSPLLRKLDRLCK